MPAVALSRGAAAERVAAMTALLQGGRRAMAEEIAALLMCLDDENKRVQRCAAETLIALGDRNPEIVDQLHPLLSAPSERQRWGAVFTLARLGSLPPVGLDTLIDVIGCDDGDRRWAAAELLMRMARELSPLVVPRLLATASYGALEARKMALYCLRDLDVREGYGAAEEALRQPDIGVRLAGLSALSRLTVDRATTARHVAALVEDPDARIGRAAAATLGSLGITAPDVVDVLRRAAVSDDESLRRAATRSLKQLEMIE